MKKEEKVQEERDKERSKTELQRLQYITDLGVVARTPAGQRVMLHLLERAGIMNQVMVPGESDRSFLNEGRRLFGLSIMKDLMQAYPENFTMPVMKFKVE